MPRVEPEPFENLGQLSDFLGGRTLLRRVPVATLHGRAGFDDVLAWQTKYGVRFELARGFLVANPFSPARTVLANTLRRHVRAYTRRNWVGVTNGPGSLVVFGTDTAYAPDVSFVRAERDLPGRRPLPLIDTRVPDFVAQILERRNTRGEMLRKRKEYFLAGVRLVWEIDPRTRTATAYTAPDAKTVVPADGTLDGGAVLPGFRLPLADLFAKLEPPPAAKTKPRRRK